MLRWLLELDSDIFSLKIPNGCPMRLRASFLDASTHELAIAACFSIHASQLRSTRFNRGHLTLTWSLDTLLKNVLDAD